MRLRLVATGVHPARLAGRGAGATPCDDALDTIVEAGAGENGPPLATEAFNGLVEEFLRRSAARVEVKPDDPLLATAEGKLALLEASASVDGNRLLSLQSVLERAATGEPDAVHLRDRLLAIGDALSLDSGLRIDRSDGRKIKLVVDDTPTARDRLVEVLLGLSMASRALTSSDAAVRSAGAWAFAGRKIRLGRLRSALQARVEAELVRGHLEKGLDRLGLLGTPGLRERFREFRTRNANTLASIVGLSINVPFMWAFGTQLPLYIPKFALTRTGRLSPQTVAESDRMFQEGVPFDQHWTLARTRYEKDFGPLPEVDVALRWARNIHTVLIAAMLGQFFYENLQLMLNGYTVGTTSRDDRVKVDNDTFNSKRVRDVLFEGWRKAYPVPDSAATAAPWLDKSFTDADKVPRRPPAEVKKALEARFDEAAHADPKLAAGRIYARRYIKEFVKTYHEKTDEQLKLK
jgi:hypothetical protein